MFFSISILLIRNLHDVVGENDAARRRAVHYRVIELAFKWFALCLNKSP
jgi:hypothetical protein